MLVEAYTREVNELHRNPGESKQTEGDAMDLDDHEGDHRIGRVVRLWRICTVVCAARRGSRLTRTSWSCNGSLAQQADNVYCSKTSHRHPQPHSLLSDQYQGNASYRRQCAIGGLRGGFPSGRHHIMVICWTGFDGCALEAGWDVSLKGERCLGGDWVDRLEGVLLRGNHKVSIPCYVCGSLRHLCACCRLGMS